MQYTEYGRTGKQVSVVGFGGMRFDVKRSREENAELLRYASECGITYFDTAPNYCEDQSEDIFGLAFKDMPRPFHASTKGMPTEFDTADKARMPCGVPWTGWDSRRSPSTTCGVSGRWSTTSWQCAPAGSTRGSFAAGTKG